MLGSMAGTHAPKALVVDDAAFTRTILKDILLAHGFSKVYEARDGAEAVEAFKKYRPNIVTMDVIMPNGDGLQALREILTIDAHAKVVMVTAVGQEQVVEETRKLGAKDYLVKPFEGSTVAKVVRRVLEAG